MKIRGPNRKRDPIVAPGEPRRWIINSSKSEEKFPLIQLVNANGVVVDPEKMRQVSSRLSWTDVIDIHTEMVTIHYACHQLFGDGQIAKGGKKRATLAIVPADEFSAVAVMKVLRPEDVIETYGRYWDVEHAKGVTLGSIFDGFYENPNPAALEDFIRNRCFLPTVPVGIQLVHAAGIALSKKIRKEPGLIYAYTGEGGTC